MNIALPKKGFSGVEKKADTAAWTNNMAESMGKLVKDLNIYLVITHTHMHTFTPLINTPQLKQLEKWGSSEEHRRKCPWAVWGVEVKRHSQECTAQHDVVKGAK